MTFEEKVKDPDSAGAVLFSEVTRLKRMLPRLAAVNALRPGAE
jgi:hypothetical protein